MEKMNNFCRHWDQANYDTCFCNTGYDCDECCQYIGKIKKNFRINTNH